MQFERTSGFPYRAGFMAVAVAATCAVGATPVGDSSVRRLGSESYRVPIVRGSSLHRFGEAEPDYFVVGEDQPIFDIPFRETTEREHVIAELRRWRRLDADWDGEGAKAPVLVSLNAARAFLCAMKGDAKCPEPTLFPSGRAGLYWREEGFYADLEFYANGTIAYYIERGQDRHKGVVAFDLNNIPVVFQALL